jgi:hypothetical protein
VARGVLGLLALETKKEKKTARKTYLLFPRIKRILHMIRSQEKLKLDFNGKYVSKFLRDMELVITRDHKKGFKKVARESIRRH